MRIALVTCANLPEPDPDRELLMEALRNAKLQVEWLAWDDPNTDPGGFDLCVLRSCWNYYENPRVFLDWIETTARVSRLLNPPQVVRWNLHKGYLRELDARGVPIIPTAWVSKGTQSPLEKIVEENGWTDVVIKPAVSAGSFQTRRFSADQLRVGQTFLDELSRERDVMIQQYMTSIENEGERALIWIAGRWTHAIRKSPRFSGGDEQVSEASEVSAKEQTFAERVLTDIKAELLYARLDVIRAADGRLCLSELELIEPSLFFLQHPPALKHFVRAVAQPRCG
ncbi:MAG: hypothetical protein MI923_12205 [Phycisphaerales bacterium]|nr:hypothetical protein [Phycisphaerales bacterium]